ncbi:heterokaryon incompatibility protein-domain-containing protein, partial [Parachaetomium inaequale]
MLKRIFSSQTPSPPRPAAVEAAVGLTVPTYPLAGTHRLHHIPELCPACKQIDTRVIAVSERYTLLTNFWDLEVSAIDCRFCALLVQTLRENDNRDIDTTLAALGLTRKDSCSLCLSLEAGILRVYVAPCCSKITDYGVTLAELESGTHFDHAECSIQDRAKIATTAVETVLESLPPCSCPNDGTRGRYTDRESYWHQSSSSARVGPLSAPALPTRVIDLGISDLISRSRLKLHLYLSSLDNPTFAHYATLSHRWGGRIPFTTTISTFTKRVNGFWLGEIPQSFQDAVLVARSLGLRYLWVDSLCIVQDDEADWLAKSQQMGRIFANASVTIAAHSAQDSTQGFLGAFLVPGFLGISPENPSDGFTIPMPDLSSDALLKRFSRSCLSSRAWVMQELCLSPRILHFVENRVLWECEHTPVQIGAASPPTWAALLGNAGDGYQFIARIRHLATSFSWFRTSLRPTTLQQQLDSLFASSLSHNYHCGIFNADVERSILWYSSQAPKPLQKPLNRAPTWSWASVDGRLAF